MQINIRSEQASDFKCVEELAREAFWNLYFPGANEHFVVHVMRNHRDYIKDLSFVIEVNNQVQGAIFFTYSKVCLDNGDHVDCISFGPVFISPKLHRQSLGKKLITHAIGIAKNMGYKAILTLGYPYHYTPYGFVGAKKYNISMPDGNFYTGLLALPLIEGSLDNIKGYAVFSDVFEVDAEEVDLYDKNNFAPKEKQYNPCQDDFARACAELDV